MRLQAVFTKKPNKRISVMADAPSTPLPEFDAPPIVETLLGVQFQRLETWGIPHFGLFWQSIRDEYPRFEVRPPLEPQMERFEPESSGRRLRATLLNEPPLRCWFLNETGGRLLQLQNGHFIHNWRGVGKHDSYPRYDKSIRPAFESEWGRFCEFLANPQMPQPQINQGEVTYVNHIDRGKGWDTMRDIPHVLSCWSGDNSGDFLPAPESVVISSKYLLPDQQGRLQIVAEPAIRHVDAQEILQLTLTVRGRPSSSNLPEILKWFDLGREWVVRGFADFTHADMHTLGKRKR